MNTQTKHTPGPWTANENLCVFAEDGLICKVAGTSNTCVESNANAKLIASAPEMADTIIRLEREKAELLEALNIIMRQSDIGFIDSGRNGYDAIGKKARAAIANATGKVTR